MSTSEASATVIPIEDLAPTTSAARAETTGKAPVVPTPPPVTTTATTTTTAAPAPAPATIAGGATRKARTMPLLLRSDRGGWRRGLAILDFLLRICAFGATLAAAISTGTSNETLSFFTQFFQFHANYADFPAFTFFVVGNAIAAGYLVLSLPFSAVTVLRPKATGLRLLLLIFDTGVMALTTAAASSAAAIVYLAHEGNVRANWAAICMQFNGFCERTSGAVVGSFIAVLIIMLLVIMSALSIRKH